ncbi:MAG: aspartate/glutamate racemase family protein [Limosilactobacillus sp.]
MQKLGIIGGIGPEATMNYYAAIIKRYQQYVGTDKDLPALTIESINMYHLFELLDAGGYDEAATYVSAAANRLLKAGCDFGLMCGNTPHLLFEQIQSRTALPLLSIVQTAVVEAEQQKLHRLALLGTKFTMQHDFFAQPFRAAGIKISLPNAEQQALIHQKIVDELENGIVKSSTKEQLLAIINQLAQDNQLDGVVLGCTELPLILGQDDFKDLRVFDIAKIQINAAVKRILQEDK